MVPLAPALRRSPGRTVPGPPGRQRWDGPGVLPARSWSSATGATEQPRLQAGVRRLGTQPDGQQRPGEVIPGDRALHLAIEVHLNARARLVGQGHALTALHVRHPTFELLNALLEGWYLRFGVLRKAFIPGLLEVSAIDLTHEVEDELLGGVRRQDGMRIRGLLYHVQRRDIDVDLEHRGLA